MVTTSAKCPAASQAPWTTAESLERLGFSTGATGVAPMVTCVPELSSQQRCQLEEKRQKNTTRKREGTSSMYVSTHFLSNNSTLQPFTDS